MTPEHIKKLLAEGEGLTIEFKECVNELNNGVWETVCSFSNRYGGHLLLGVRDDGEVIGVNPKAVEQMKKNFINTLSNPQKVSPTLLLELEDVEVDGKIVLYAYVTTSSQVELCANKIYDRMGDADVDITKSTDLAADLYGRKSAAYTEREIFPYVTENEMRLDLVEKARKMALGEKRNHPWKGMTAMELMKSAGLYDEDWRTGKKGFNLAGILLFGRDDVISSCAPGFETDALVRRNNLDRYDDRLIVGTNLIEAYDRLIEYIEKHTMDRFFLVDNQRVSVRSWIAREIVSNILVHREYSKGYPAKIIIESDRIYAENWSRSNRHGRIDPDDFAPDPKNPIIARFFVNIGLADKLGSGVRNLYKYAKIYSGGIPELIEGDVFKTIVPLKGIGTVGFTGDGIGDNSGVTNVTNTVPNLVTTDDVEKRMLTLLADDAFITTRKIAESLSMSERSAKRHIKRLKDAGILVRIGGTRGHWRIVANTSENE
jgi:ATP-dependent DNA helicase RecG